MVLEQQLNLATNTVHGDPTNVVDNRPPSIDGGDDGSKAPRLPRWTRQEILVLIQGKKVAENRVRRGRTAGMAFGSGQVEPKWASVSSYCKRHGVNRGPVQCRKRWSNLAGDYKKIKEWETQIREETESFWVMRNDLRRERKLPGFFDREVYDILDGVGGVSPAAPGLALALAPSTEPAEDVEMVFDSGRSAAAEDGLFSDFEQEEASGSPDKVASAAKEVPPIKAAAAGVAAPVPISGTTNEKHPASNPEVGSASHENRKRKRLTTDGDEETINVQNQLIDVLEKNGKMLTAQLKAQNTNFQLDREQRKDHADSLVAVLNKLADALGKIADKL
ncbi:trihelix transcription factor ASR3 isoform X2 [Hevea brasiliensis]|uniref:trihelix transcription factor ASR3 isoform X2 n=1 Tax=Hevea brasiliensis TaxID=3981 RepID=UPI000B78BEA1|nr:trihelix transcription factor ASR3 isoform X2 [Hevea brasiliensis]